MQFDLATFNATIQKINSGLITANGRLGAIPVSSQHLLASADVPANIKQFVADLVKKLVAAGQAFLKKLIEVMEGAAAPIMFAKRAFDWKDVRSELSTVSGLLRPASLADVDANWQGPAAGQYGKSRGNQEAAVSRLMQMAEALMLRLGLAASAGVALYLGVALVLVKFVVGLTAALTALGTWVLAPGGLAYALTQTGVSLGELVAFVSACVYFVGQQTEMILNLEVQAGDNQFFPGGHWPASRKDLFSDATVMDGDADWSMVQQPPKAN